MAVDEGLDDVRVPKMAELVAERIRGQIIRGTLQAGESLEPETALMKRFGVSRPTLREAFRVLEAERLISVRRGARGGARVQVPDGEVAARYAGLVLQYRDVALKDVYQARVYVEAPAAAIVAKRHTKHDLKRLRLEIDKEYQGLAGEQSAAAALQTEFHQLLIELTGNKTLTLISGMLHRIIAAANQNVVAREAGSEYQKTMTRTATCSHERLVELIEAKDVDGADRLWRKHLDESAKFVLAGLRDETILDVLS